MLPEALLRQLGLFIRRGFLDPHTCVRINQEMSRASRRPAASGIDNVVSDDVRKASLCEVAPATVSDVRSRIEALVPEMAEHFATPLSELQPLNFLQYQVGDHHVAHRDASQSPPYDTRKVSLSILLQDESDEERPDTFGGGRLVFYGLMGDESSGVPIRGESGMLVAFASSVVHEVQPVQRGIRRSLVTWIT